MNTKGFALSVDSIYALSIAVLLGGLILSLPLAQRGDAFFDSLDQNVGDMTIVSYYTATNYDQAPFVLPNDSLTSCSGDCDSWTGVCKPSWRYNPDEGAGQSTIAVQSFCVEVGN